LTKALKIYGGEKTPSSTKTARKSNSILKGKQVLDTPASNMDGLFLRDT
jgi:hypothetical protein